MSSCEYCEFSRTPILKNICQRLICYYSYYLYYYCSQSFILSLSLLHNLSELRATKNGNKYAKISRYWEQMFYMGGSESYRISNLVEYSTIGSDAIVKRCSVKKLFSKISQKLTWKHLCQSLFFNVSTLIIKKITILDKRLETFLWNVSRQSFCNFLPKNFKVWLLGGRLGTRRQTQVFQGFSWNLPISSDPKS